MSRGDIRYKYISKYLLNASVVIFIIVFCLIHFMTNNSTSLFTMISGLSAFILYGFLICHLGNLYSLLKRFNQIVAFSYTIILGIILLLVFQLDAIVSGIVIILYYLIFLSYDNKESGKMMFLIGLTIGAMALYKPDVFYLTIIVALSLIEQKSFSLRNVVTLFYAAMMPLWVYIPVMYLSDKTNLLLYLDSMGKQLTDVSLISFGGNDMVSLPVLMVILLLNITFYIINKHKNKIDNIKTQNIIGSNNIFLYGIILASVFFSDKSTLISLTLMPTILNVSYNITNLKNKFIVVFVLTFNILLMVTFFIWFNYLQVQL